MADDKTIDTVDDDYNEASDEDFDPQAAAIEPDQESSDSDHDDATANKTGRRSRPQRPQNEEDLDFDNSGDELTIKHGRKKRRKTGNKTDDADDDDDVEESGEGGFVRTRAQRKTETMERRALADASQSKVDVDALWAAMSAPPPLKPPEEHSGNAAPAVPQELSSNECRSALASPPIPKSTEPPAAADEAMVTIKRKYDFAGQTIEEERRVPAASAEAKLYLEEQQQKATPVKPGLKRPMKRKTPFGAFAGDAASSSIAPGAGKKLTTLEKSKLDWAAHVDKEGIADELDEASRAKGSYMGKVDFLGRMDAKRDDELRRKP